MPDITISGKKEERKTKTILVEKNKNNHGLLSENLGTLQENNSQSNVKIAKHNKVHMKLAHAYHTC